METSFIDRLKEFMEQTGLKQIDIANKTGMSRGSISNILSGKRTPNEKVLTELSKISGKSINWWLFGEDEYVGLASLNMLVDTFIKNGDIKPDGTYDDKIEIILHTMLDKEIRDKIKEAQR